MTRRWVLIGFFMILPSFCWAQSSANVIRIKPTLPCDMAGRDMARLKLLATGVGWEFEPDAQTDQGLIKIGVNRIRCINIEPFAGTFDEKGMFHIDPGGNPYLLRQLATCRLIGADPHLIIATALHRDLVLKEKDLKADNRNILGLVHSAVFGPTDWVKFQNYCKAVFQYILIDQKFPNACFEVGNEPDAGGFFADRPPKPAPGSRAGYEAYFNMYKHVALAAKAFEKEHPGMKVMLGGPAVTWAYTFKYGDFNWTQRFLQDVHTQKVKLNFIGLHFYGNMSPLTGESKGVYPSYEHMLSKTREWRDQFAPEVPIWFTEWGASYHTDLTPGSILNGNHVGAAWAAAFLNQMLIGGVEKASYLVTTDLKQKIDGQWKDIWGWPSLFTNPTVSGVHPKAVYHVFEMIHRMGDQRVEATRPNGTMGVIAADDSKAGLTILLWNNSFAIPEFGPGTETGQEENVVIQIVDADRYFKGPVRIHRYLVSRSVSNACDLFEKGEKIDHRAELQTVEQSTARPVDDTISLGFIQPPSSVSFIEIMPQSETKATSQPVSCR